jgi:hypothetical protein
MDLVIHYVEYIVLYNVPIHNFVVRIDRLEDIETLLFYKIFLPTNITTYKVHERILRVSIILCIP